MGDVLSQPVKINKVDPKFFISSLRREFVRPMHPLIADHAAALVVAVMRATGRAPRVGLVSQIVLEFVGHANIAFVSTSKEQEKKFFGFERQWFHANVK